MAQLVALDLLIERRGTWVTSQEIAGRFRERGVVPGRMADHTLQVQVLRVLKALEQKVQKAQEGQRIERMRGQGAMLTSPDPAARHLAHKPADAPPGVSLLGTVLVRLAQIEEALRTLITKVDALSAKTQPPSQPPERRR